MFVRIDEEAPRIEGFVYTNKAGDDEKVVVDDTCSIGLIGIHADNDFLAFYHEDIPKLIKALQAAYNYKKGLQHG